MYLPSTLIKKNKSKLKDKITYKLDGFTFFFKYTLLSLIIVVFIIVKYSYFTYFFV